MEKMMKLSAAIAAVSVLGLAATGHASVWQNAGTDFNTPSNWDVMPGAGDIATFTGAATVQPDVSASIAVGGINFSSTTSSGYQLTASNSAVLSLGSTGTGVAGAINAANTTGTNTISAGLNLAAAAGSTQTFTQAAGGTLVLGGSISGGSATSTLTLAGTGIYAINAANSYSGKTTISGAGTVRIGDKAAFGSSSIQISAGTALTAGATNLTGANKLTNAIALTSGLSLRTAQAGDSALELGGALDLGGAARSIAVGGTAANPVIISGVISNDNGAGVSFGRADINPNSVILSGLNTYTGTTSITDGYVSVSRVGNTGEASNLGKGGTINISYVGSRPGGLRYTGSGETTDKILRLGSGTGTRSIDTTGATGGLVFTSDVAFVSGTTTTLFVLAGDSVGNEIAGDISHAGGAVKITKNGSGSWSLSGTITSAAPTDASDGMTINAGTLYINGDSSGVAGKVTVNSTGTLAGHGTIGGATTVGSGAFLSPGTSAGTLTFGTNLSMANGSTAIFEGGDQVNVGGQLALTNNWTLQLMGGFKDGGSVTLFNYGTLGASPDLIPTFNTANLGFSPSGPLTLSDTGSSIVLNGISLIPEPTSLALVSAGAMLLARRRRASRAD